MKYTIDYEITPDMEKMENLSKNIIANYSTSYFSQLKEKLNFTFEKLETEKQVKEKDDEGKEVLKKVKVKVYRLSADMVTIRPKLLKDRMQRKPKKFTGSGTATREEKGDK